MSARKTSSSAFSRWNSCASPSAPRCPPPACAGAATKRPPTRPPSTPCAASSTVCPSTATIVIGEGERDEAPMLFIGEEVGTGKGPKVDIAVDPLEGTTLCAKDMPNAIAVMAMAQAGSLLHAPDVYMDKIAIGPGYPAGVVDLDATPDRQHPCAGQGQGREAARDHRADPGPPAPCGPDRRRAQDRRLDPPDHRRRRRRRHLHRPARPRPASTSTSASAARPKACWPRPRCAASAARCRAA